MLIKKVSVMKNIVNKVICYSCSKKFWSNIKIRNWFYLKEIKNNQIIKKFKNFNAKTKNIWINFQVKYFKKNKNSSIITGEKH